MSSRLSFPTSLWSQKLGDHCVTSPNGTRIITPWTSTVWVAIDVHTHVHRSVNAPQAKPEDNEHLAAMAAYFKTAAASFTVDDLAAYYRERNMAAVTFTIDQREAPEDPSRATPMEIIERARDQHADILIPFGSVDPNRGAEAVKLAKRQIEAGAKGFKFHPAARPSCPTTGWPTRSTR